MRNEEIDKERLEDVRRKKMLIKIAAAVVVLTVFSGIGLSRMAVHNVDTKKGVQKLKELEKADIKETEKKIAEFEAKERRADKEWQNRPLEEKFANAVIMGDSITTGFSGYKVLDSSKIVAEKGVHLNELEEMIETTVNLNPQVLFLALGVNDVSMTNGDMEAFKASYKKVIDTLQKKLPETKIYVNCILPTTEKRIKEEPSYKMIPDYNDVLRELCKEEGLVYIDNTVILKEEYYEPDGEHVTKAFYPVWGEHMAGVAEI